MELDFEEQAELGRMQWAEQHKIRNADREHEKERDSLYGAARLAMTEKWTNCILFVATLGFIATLLAIYHG